jgi:hypothetical protein
VQIVTCVEHCLMSSTAAMLQIIESCRLCNEDGRRGSTFLFVAFLGFRAFDEL